MTNDLFRDLTAAVFCYNNNAAPSPLCGFSWFTAEGSVVKVQISST